MLLPAEKYATSSVRPYETKDKSGNITAYKWRAVLPYRKEDGSWGKKSVTLKTEGRDKGRSKQVEKAAQIEAEDMRRALNEEAAKQAIEEPKEQPKTVTVNECVEAYIRTKSMRVTATTITGYKKSALKQIGPYLGDKDPDALTPTDVEKWLKKLGREYSPATTRKAFILLKSAMRQAVERGEIRKNPTRTVETPRQKDKARPNSLTEAERGRVVGFLNLNPEDALSLGVRLALYTGARQGELCAIRWKGVDLDKGTIKITEALGRADKADIGTLEGAQLFSGVYIKQPKTAGSKRTLSIPKSCVEALRARHAEMRRQCMEAGVPFSQDLFVLGQITGEPMHPHNLWRRWAALATALDLKGTEGREVTFHDLRHTYATTSIANGIDVKTVSSSMGHSNAAMTLNTYATADPDAARRAAEAIERAYAEDAQSAKAMGEVVELDRTGTDGQ